MEASILISSTSFYLISTVFGRAMFLQSIADTSRKILNKIEGKICYQNEDIDNMYQETDIIATLNTLQLLINEVENIDSSPTLTNALNNLNTVIIEIHDLLDKIEYKINEHRAKYFNYFRNVNVYNEIISIKKKNLILDKRLNLLIKIMQINRFNLDNKYFNHINMCLDKNMSLDNSISKIADITNII